MHRLASVVCTLLLICAVGHAVEPTDPDAVCQRIIDAYEAFSKSPEAYNDDGVWMADRIGEHMKQVLANVDFGVFGATHLAHLAEANALQFSPEATRRAVARLDELASGADVDAALAAIARMVLLTEIHTDDTERMVAAIRAAIAHPAYSAALGRMNRPTAGVRCIVAGTPEVTEAVMPDILEFVAAFPLDVPIEVASYELPQLYRLLQSRAGEDRPQAVERARRRFTKVVAEALLRLDDDDELLGIRQRLNPHTSPAQPATMAVEGMRRTWIRTVRETLVWFVSPAARGTLEGHRLPPQHFIWARRADSDPDRTPLKSTSDLHGRLAVIVAVPLFALTEPERSGSVRSMDMIRRLAERFEDQPLSVLVLTEPMHHPTTTFNGTRLDPPDDLFETLPTVVHSGARNFAVALVDDATNVDTGMTYWFDPILVDE